MPHQSINSEKGPKGTRCVTHMTWTGRSPYLRPRTWRSNWFTTDNENRDFCFAEMELQKRISDAVQAGIFPN